MALTTYTYEQLGLDTGMEYLTDKEKKALEKSWAAAFAAEIFPCIDERIFRPLFSENRGGRNVPVNVLAGALLLQALRGMSDEELIGAAMFDLRLRTALHITNAVGQPLSLRTLQRFRTRLRRHRETAGEDLLRTCLEKIGDRLAAYVRDYEKNSPWYAYVSGDAARGTRRAGKADLSGAAAGAGKGAGEPGETASMPGTAGSGAGVQEALAAALLAGMLGTSFFDPEIVRDPEVFCQNRLPAHSDHVWFADEEELEAGKEEPAGTAGTSSLRMSLNGLWKFSYAGRPQDAPAGFEDPGYDCSAWADIPVPAHIQLEGYDTPAYINYQYPWDGREDIVPGEIPQEFNPTASYVKFFRLPACMQGRPVFISFQGVESGFALWCNGRYVGYSEDSFTPSEFDLTPFVRKGENRLAVRVFKWTASSWLESQDFFRFSGIFRDVYLYTVPDVHLYDLRISPQLDESLQEGTLQVEAQILLTGTAARRALRRQELCLAYTLTKKGDPAAEAVCSGKTLLSALPAADPSKAGPDRKDCDGTGNGFRSLGLLPLSFSEKIEKPALWSAEDPQLYELTLRLMQEPDQGQDQHKVVQSAGPNAPEDPGSGTAGAESGQQSDETGAQQGGAGAEHGETDHILFEIVRERAGFRRFELVDGLMRINGERIVFRGVNRHEFTCDSGRVVPAEVTRQDLILMKQNNINAVRTCHYPNSSALYRDCDELGLYLIAENNMESHGSWAPVEAGLPTPGIVPGDDPAWRPMLLDRVNSCYQRDKNHPSVLIWSVGNESFGGSVIRDMADCFRRLDPGRPVHYEGIFHDRTWPQTSDMESQMYPSAEAVEAFLQEHPDKPFICCEYTHAMGNSCGGMHRYTDLTLREPRYQGGFIWDFVDQSLRMKNRFGEEFQAYGGDCGERPTDYDFSGNGIVDGTRKPYAGKMQEVKFNYQPIRLEVGRDSVRVMNDNLFTGTDFYDCVVILEREGVRTAEAVLETAVPPLSEKTYRLPEAILDGIARIEAEAAGPDGPAEYAVTVSMRLAGDCAWAKRGHETAFGQGVFGAGSAAGTGTETTSVTDSAAANTPVSADTERTSVTGTMQANERAAGRAAGQEGMPHRTRIAGTDWQRTILLDTKDGVLALTRGSFNIGVRGGNFDALFSLLRGGLVSFRRGGHRGTGTGFSAADRELFAKLPRPCFWRAPTSNDDGNRMAARHGIWKLADQYQIPRPETLEIFTEQDSVLLQMQYALPVSWPSENASGPVPVSGPDGADTAGDSAGAVADGIAAQAAQAGNPLDQLPFVTAGYRFRADGSLTLTLDWDPMKSGDWRNLPSMPVFGFFFQMDADCDRFSWYGRGPAENYVDRCRGARLGIYHSRVRDNMSPYLVPQECGNRTGVRWAEVTDARGRGVRFAAGDGPDSRMEEIQGPASRVKPSMEFSALPWTPQELESAAHPYELPPVHFTTVRCALMQMGVGGDDSWGARTLPQYCLPAGEKLHFEVTVEGI